MSKITTILLIKRYKISNKINSFIGLSSLFIEIILDSLSMAGISFKLNGIYINRNLIKCSESVFHRLVC